MPALALLRPAGLIASFMEVTCASVSGRPDEKLLVKNLMTFLLSKEYFALSKVHSSLSKEFRVRALGRLLPLHLRGRGTFLCGIFWTRRAQTASHRRESRKPSRRGCRSPRRARLSPPSKLPHHGC